MLYYIQLYITRLSVTTHSESKRNTIIHLQGLELRATKHMRYFGHPKFVLEHTVSDFGWVEDVM